MTSKKKKWLLTAGTTVLILVVLEVVLRMQFASHRQAKGFQLDGELGWRTVANCELKADVPGYGPTSFSTGEYGFRRFGDLESTKKRVFVIGDSYTWCETVNDGEAYFDRMAEQLDAEVFAYGCNGYGTLQELIVLKEYFAEIQPDLVVWQLCDNDFVNNSHELESRDLLQSNFMTRPYRIGGQDIFRFPVQVGGALLQNSQLARWSYRQILARGRKQFDYSNEENKYLASQAIDLTGSLLKEAKSHVGDVPMLVFCNRHGGLYSKALVSTNFHFTLAVEQAIDAAVGAGAKVDARPRDLHWNAAGQRIVGDALVGVIEKESLLEGKTEL